MNKPNNITAASEDQPISGLESALVGGVQLQAQMNEVNKEPLYEVVYTEDCVVHADEAAGIHGVIKKAGVRVCAEPMPKADAHEIAKIIRRMGIKVLTRPIGRGAK